MEVFGKNRSGWQNPQGYLMMLNPYFLTEKEADISEKEWVTDCNVTEDTLELSPTIDGVAHAIASFPYGTTGKITLATEGKLNSNTRILLSECYFDRLNFLKDRRAKGYEDVVGEPYNELKPTEIGTWEILWDDTEITLYCGGKKVDSFKKKCDGFNHITIMFEGDGAITVKDAKSVITSNRLNTGIVY